MALAADHVLYPSGLFHPRTLCVPVIDRARLLSRIVGSGARRLTLLAAPVGYGKTVLLTQAYEACASMQRRCVWLSLQGDLGDSSLLGLLWAAADYAGVSSADGTALTVNTLLSRIEACGEPISIFIDCLSPDILNGVHTLLWQLIDGMPHGTSFLIATESELNLPIIRLEASGLLRKIGAAELALNEDDIARFGRVTSLPVWTRALSGQVEGWPALIQLALSRHRDQPSAHAPRLMGCEHDVAAFFEQEILRDLQADDLARLLDASTVDEVCGSLLDAMSGSPNGSLILGRLAARGVPIRASAKFGWFVLNPLLRGYLYDQLQTHDARRLQTLHQRAAHWLLSRGDAQGALRHATTTGDIDFLRSIHQRSNLAPTLPPDSSATSSGSTTDPKWRRFFDCIQSGQLDQARVAMAEARQQAPVHSDAAPPESHRIEWELTYGDLLMKVFDDRLPRPDQLEVLRDRLMRTPGVPTSIPAAVSELVVVSRFRGGDLSSTADAEQDLWHTRALAPPQSNIYASLELGMAALELGELDLAARHWGHARVRALQEFGPRAAQAHAASTLLAELALERGNRTEAAQLLAASFPQLHAQELWFNLAASAFTTASATAAHRSWGDAQRALELPLSLAHHVGLWRLPHLMVAQRLRLACLWGEDMASASHDRATLSSSGLLDLAELDGAGFGWRVSVPAQLAVIRFDLADGRGEAALTRSLALRPILEKRRHVRRLIELDLLQGRAAIGVGNRSVGCSLIRSALKSSVANGMLQSFIDEARFLETLICELSLANDLSGQERLFLESLPVHGLNSSLRPIRYAARGRTFELSAREAQLLRALVTGKTFKEISFAMNISMNTTKMHRTRLYRKLGCNSRSHAIALAQELLAT